jgi:WhiB family redox-sensing transcriptional regulator
LVANLLPRGRRLGIGLTTEWAEKGSCRPERLPADVLPEFFFADLSMRTEERLKVAAAKGVCQNCVIRTDCLAFAMSHCEDGVWGGLTAKERANTAGRSVRMRKLREVVERARVDERPSVPRPRAG